MIVCFVALGSNLGEPPRQLARAVEALAGLPRTTLKACSGWYSNPALGPGPQPDYLNGVAQLETHLTPRELLRELQGIESAQGRRRPSQGNQRWQPRTLDLDILLYGNSQLQEAELVIPHPRLAERAFVLRPLHDLAPDLILPCGAALATLLARCPEHAMRRAVGA